jgi:hypothetical protein
VDQTYKPDLVSHDGRDVTLWVDCGKPGKITKDLIERFHKLTRE